MAPSSGPGKSLLMSTPLLFAAPEAVPVPEHWPSVARAQPSGLREGSSEMSVVFTSRVIRGSWLLKGVSLVTYFFHPGKDNMYLAVAH